MRVSSSYRLFSILLSTIAPLALVMSFYAIASTNIDKAYAAGAKPTKAAISSVKSASAGKVTVAAKKVKRAKGYQFKVSQKKSFKGKTTKTVKSKKNKATFKGLAQGKRYYVRVRAYGKVGKTVRWGAWSAVKRVTVAKAQGYGNGDGASAGSGSTGGADGTGGSGGAGGGADGDSGSSDSAKEIVEVARAVFDEGNLVVDAGASSIAEDGLSATVSAGALGGAAPEAGQVVVIADENLQGTAIKVEGATENEDGSYSIVGSRPAFDEVFDEVEYGGTAVYSEADITYLADGVELEGVEEPSRAARSGLSAQALEGSFSPGTFKFKLTHKFFENQLGVDGANVKFSMSGDIGLSFTPSFDYALSYDLLQGVTKLEAVLNAEEEVSGTVKIDAALKVKLASFSVAGTGVDLYFTVGVDGKVGLSYKLKQSQGIDYERGRSGFFKKTSSAGGSLSLSAEGKAGLGAEAKVCLLCFDIGNLALEGGAKASAGLKPRSPSFVCSDVDAWLYAEASYKIEESIAKLGGWDAKGSWEIFGKDNTPVALLGKHYENGEEVAKCTWADGEGGAQDPVGEDPPASVDSSYAAYSLIVQDYLDCVADIAKDDSSPAEETARNGHQYVNESYFWESRTPLLRCALVDLDGDGVGELVFNDGYSGENSKSSFSYHCFTCVDGKPVEVYRGWPRSHYSIVEDGQILHRGSGGARTFSYCIMKLAGNGELIEQGSFASDWGPTDETVSLSWANPDGATGSAIVASEEANDYVAEFLSNLPPLKDDMPWMTLDEMKELLSE